MQQARGANEDDRMKSHRRRSGTCHAERMHVGVATCVLLAASEIMAWKHESLGIQGLSRVRSGCRMGAHLEPDLLGKSLVERAGATGCVQANLRRQGPILGYCDIPL